MELEKHANFIFKNAVEHFSTNHKELPEQIISIDEEQEASKPEVPILGELKIVEPIEGVKKTEEVKKKAAAAATTTKKAAARGVVHA